MLAFERRQRWDRLGWVFRESGVVRRALRLDRQDDAAGLTAYLAFDSVLMRLSRFMFSAGCLGSGGEELFRNVESSDERHVRVGRLRRNGHSMGPTAALSERVHDLIRSLDTTAHLILRERLYGLGHDVTG